MDCVVVYQQSRSGRYALLLAKVQVGKVGVLVVTDQTRLARGSSELAATLCQREPA